MKPFQVTGTDVAFTLRADPDWLPPIPPDGSSTTLRVKSMGAGVSVDLSVDKIPPGITAAFSATSVTVPPGGESSVTLTLTPTHIPPGHYGAEILGVATVDGVAKEIRTHLEFEVQPPPEFMMWDKDAMMTQMGMGAMDKYLFYFPEITLNPNMGAAGTKVSISATDFPDGANVTRLRFAGMELPVPAGTVADGNGDFTLIFNVPGDFGVGVYMVEVEAEKTGMPPVFIAKPFSVVNNEVSFNLNVVPGFIPGVTQGESGQTTVFVEATGQAVTLDLYVDGLPSGVTGVFDSSSLSVSPGGSGSTTLTITTGASTPPGHYPLAIRGVSGDKVRVVPFGFGVMPPAIFQMPEFRLDPDYAPAGYGDKKLKVTFSGTGFPALQSVASLKFGSQSVAIPDDLTTDANGSFNGVFQVPTGLDAGTYDVTVAVATGDGAYVYDCRPFTIKGGDTTFILKPSPPYLPPVVQGSQATTTVNVRSVGTSGTTVDLYIDGLAPGITAEFSPSNTVTVSPGSSVSATVTLSVSEQASPGPYPLSIRGVSGTETVVVPLGFSVMPDIGEGQGHATITLNPPKGKPGDNIGISGAGFTAGASITLTAAPPGAPIPIDITPGTIEVQSDGTWATQITVPQADQVPPGGYKIKAMDGSRAARCPFHIVHADNADFFLDISPPFLEIVQGQSGETSFRVSSKNGFKEALRFGVGGLAPGVIVTFKDTAGNTIGQFSGTSAGVKEVVTPTALTPRPGEDLIVTVLVTVDAGTPIGPYDIALEVEASSIFRAVPLGLLVSAPGASMVLSPMSGSADEDIRLSGSGFTAGETVAVTFAGTSVATIPATVTVAEDGTFNALATAPSLAAGIYPVVVTGGTSGISIDRPFALRPSAVNTFVLYASPMQLNIPKGSSATFSVKLEPVGTFQSAVALSITGLDAITGATYDFSPAAVITPNVATPTTATLNINVPEGATEGKYTLVILAESGDIAQTQKVTVRVVPPADTPDFSISLAPDTVPVNPNTSGETTVSVTSINDFAGEVALAVTMSDPAATWPAAISYETSSVTPSATTGLGKQAVTFTASADAQPGNWTFKITGTSGSLEHSTSVMVICTPSGTTRTTFASSRLDPSTVTASTPVEMAPPWGDKVKINNLIGDGSEASVITPSKMDVAPATLGSLPSGASDMLGRITNIESSAPLSGVDWQLGFPFDSDTMAAAGLEEENLKVAYLNPDTGAWTEVPTVIDAANNVAYASVDHFSSWTLIGTPTPPPSPVIAGGGGGMVVVKNVQTSGLTGAQLEVSSTGLAQSTCQLSTEDGKASLKVNARTRLLDAGGSALNSLTVSEVASPSAPPDRSALLSSYNFGPDGAIFSPAITLKLRYTAEDLPEGAVEDELYIAYWNGARWLALESQVDTAARTVTAEVTHFTQFALVSRLLTAEFDVTELAVMPAMVQPDEEVVVSATVANTGSIEGTYTLRLLLNDSEQASQELTIAAGDSQEVSFRIMESSGGVYDVSVNGHTCSFTVVEAEAVPTPSAEPVAEPLPAEEESPSPEPVAEPPTELAPEIEEIPEPEQVPSTAATQPSALFNWYLIGGIAAGVIIIIIVAWQLATRRKSS